MSRTAARDLARKQRDDTFALLKDALGLLARARHLADCASNVPGGRAQARPFISDLEEFLQRPLPKVSEAAKRKLRAKTCGACSSSRNALHHSGLQSGETA